MKAPSMTRRHFKLIAQALKDSHADARTVGTMADALATTNPRFDRQRFTDAATAEVEMPAPSAERAEVLARLSASPIHQNYVALYRKAA